MKQFLKDSNALLVLGGLHSPPYIKYRNFINENGILLLVPWAAGGPITRYPDGTNWVFRLSIDDTKAGYTLIQHAQKMGCKNKHLLLESTPWGRSNEITMRKAMGADSSFATTWFNWNTKLNGAKIMIRDIIQTNADCIMFVGNAIEGEQFVNAMASFPKDQQLPIVSHWGITGGVFYDSVKQALGQGLVLHFIQSCFSLRDYQQNQLAQQVIERAQSLFAKEFETPATLPAPTGFIHSYDLGKLLVKALQKVDLTKDVAQVREQLRDELEQLGEPISGLIKTYRQPFSMWSQQQDDAHEALGLSDFCMAKFDTDGGVTLLPQSLQGLN
jgi:branched-chain amino acid transport system substrate-binding protein